MRSKCLSLMLTLSLLLTIPVWAAKEKTYQSRTFSNAYATLTIDKTRELERQEGGYIIYGVPADAQITITIQDAPEEVPLYIGTAYSLTENGGNANTGGLVTGMAESVLVGDTLTPVYRSDGSSKASFEDNSWVGRDVRKNGTYTFNLNSVEFVGWEFSPLCGTRMERSPMPDSDGSGFHGFLGTGNFYAEDEEYPLIDFQVEPAVNARPSADPKPAADTKPSDDAKTSYQSRTFSNLYATLTIDKTRELERKEGWYTIYGVPADAQITVTIHDTPETVYDDPVELPLYIGASYSLLENDGNANTGGLVLGTVESVLIGDTLTPVYRDGGGNESFEDNSWVGRDTREIGTYTFSLNAADLVNWNLVPLCGTRMERSPMPGSDGSGFHGFLGMDGGFNGGEDNPLVSFRVEAAQGAAPSTGGNSMQAPGFEDVAVNSPYVNAIYWAVERGITNGTTPATFSPNDLCTKSQILTFLWRSQKEPASDAVCPVPDVDARSPYYKALCWAGEQGMIGKTEKGSDACTRSTAVTYLWKLAGSPKAEGGAFKDVPSDAAYAQAVAWAVSEKITTGKTADTFVPDEGCSRGQIVTFLYRAYSE